MSSRGPSGRGYSGAVSIAPTVDSTVDANSAKLLRNTFSTILRLAETFVMSNGWPVDVIG